ncbi:MAG: hypothetical protein IRZ11_08020, partial [Clostridia bacterium]|nr:hypothetical protein [Clostridia bacterium]
MKEVARLLADAGRRRRAEVALVEGEKLVRELFLRVGPAAVMRLYVLDPEAAPGELAAYAEALGEELARLWGRPPTWAAPAALRRMADARTPPIALALARRPRAKAAAVWARPGPARGRGRGGLHISP